MSTQYMEWTVPKPQPTEFRSPWRIEQEARRAEERLRFVPKPTVRLEVRLVPKRVARVKPELKEKVSKTCKTCAVVVANNNQTGLCAVCYRANQMDAKYGPIVSCSECGVKIKRGVLSGLCCKHRKAKYYRERKANENL